MESLRILTIYNKLNSSLAELPSFVTTLTKVYSHTDNINVVLEGIKEIY
jgi:hypothetical protein